MPKGFYARKPEDITGQKFNRLIAVRFIKKIYYGKSSTHIWEFICDCENIIQCSKYAVTWGHTMSCGCLNKERLVAKHTTHGLSKTKFYNTFISIRHRCNNENDFKYSIYGGKGIKCEWESFNGFRGDMYPSYLAHVAEFGEKNTTIDRIDSNGSYCKENCRWATYKVQNNNLSKNRMYTYNGETLCISDWAKKIGVGSGCISKRLAKCHNDIALALSKPYNKHFPK